MADDRKNVSANGGNIDGAGLWDQRDCEEGDMSSSLVNSCEVLGSTPTSVINLSVSGESRPPRNGISLADRLAESLLGGDCDLLLQQSERESHFLQWLQTLDMQVMGACRTDERMKPLLKANASGVAEDRLLTYLNEHFETAEVGLLARCLCIPLVSIRVGKIIKHGTTLCPTSSRGILNVALLPSSEIRISFAGDDGQTEKISIVNVISFVEVEEIPADTSSRSFLIRVPGVEVFYFWLSEKSERLGKELLSKMKDLLKRKPTLASLTGIDESRLNCFASHLRAYLLGSGAINTGSSTAASSTILLDAISEAYELGQSSQSFLMSAKLSRHRHNGSQSLKTHTLYQGSLSPRSNSFKEGLTRNSSSLRSASREKLKPRHLSLCSSGTAGISTVDPNPCVKGKKFTEVTTALNFLESLRTVSLAPTRSAESEGPLVGSVFSPYYCWCPPCTSSSAMPGQLPLPVELVPLSTLAHQPALTLADVPPLDFPSLFTPLMCDPIVHIPVIDFCSSGQGYLVSTGPAAMTTSIPSLMMPESESAIEKGARETLRLLMSSSNNFSSQGETSDKPSMLIAGSRGLYCGSSDVDAIANGIAAVDLLSFSERSMSWVHATGSNSSSSGDGRIEGEEEND